MAINVGDIVVGIKLELQQYQTALKQAQTGIKNFVKKII